MSDLKADTTFRMLPKHNEHCHGGCIGGKSRTGGDVADKEARAKLKLVQEKAIWRGCSLYLSKREQSEAVE
jgi:hypothetical protein